MNTEKEMLEELKKEMVLLNKSLIGKTIFYVESKGSSIDGYARVVERKVKEVIVKDVSAYDLRLETTLIVEADSGTTFETSLRCIYTTRTGAEKEAYEQNAKIKEKLETSLKSIENRLKRFNRLEKQYSGETSYVDQKPLIIYAKEEAPAEFRALFSDDDLDYIAVVDKSSDMDFEYLVDFSRFGCSGVVEKETEKYLLYGGYHA